MTKKAPTSFPEWFSWGVASAGHQIEGANVNSDWWAFEHQPGTICAESSGDACDSWHRWPDDVALVADLGFDNYRFSVEWSRVEPAPGEYSIAALDHYRRICAALRDRGVGPVITLNHFTLPQWFAIEGGWERADAVDRFAAFAERVVAALGDTVSRVCTLNEPNIVADMGWVTGMFPPGKTDPADPAARAAVIETLINAHRRAIEVVRAGAPDAPVGLTLSMTDYQPAPDGDDAVTAAKIAEHCQSEDTFLRAVDGDDFLGVQVYTRMQIGPDGWLGPQPGVLELVMGYEYWPEALEACLRRASQVTDGRVPLWVTENGIATDDDEQRIAYVRTALEGVLRAIADGIDVEGYSYWSLLDNFEWAFGYRPHFGLVAVDRSTFERAPKPSAAWFARVVSENALPPLVD